MESDFEFRHTALRLNRLLAHAMIKLRTEKSARNSRRSSSGRLFRVAAAAVEGFTSLTTTDLTLQLFSLLPYPVSKVSMVDSSQAIE